MKMEWLVKVGFVVKRLLGTGASQSRRVTRGLAALVIAAVAIGSLATAVFAWKGGLAGTWRAFDTAGNELNVPLRDVFGSDGMRYYLGSVGSRSAVWLGGGDGVPDTGPVPFGYYIDYGRHCNREEAPYFWTMGTPQDDCWVYGFLPQISTPGPWGDLVPIETTAADGSPLVFKQFDVSGNPDLAGRCFTGMTNPLMNGPAIDWIGWKSWVDVGAGTGMDYSINAIYAPLSPDTSAPLINIQAPLDCSVFDLNSEVHASYTCVDPGGSDPNPACTSDVANGGLIDTTKRGTHTLSVTGTDAAGNTRTRYITYTVTDFAAPVASPARTPAAGDNGWNDTDITVAWNWSDSGSGIDPANCTTSSTSSGEGILKLTATCKDLAGNEGSASYEVRVDKGAPVGVVTQNPAANANGWNNSEVSVEYTWSDAGAGFRADPTNPLSCASPSQDNITIEGIHPTSRECTDKLGKQTSLGLTVQLDLTPPSVSLTGGPVDGASYPLGEVPAAPACEASDALSGVDGECSVTGYATTQGTHTVTASATDRAGNTSRTSATYTVVGQPAISGFYQPVEMGDVWNTMKGGATVPLKFEVFSESGELTDTASIQGLTVKGVACPVAGAATDPVELTVSGGTALRYDATDGLFIQTWQTPKKAGTCYTATITTVDGLSISANFMLK